MDKNSLLMMHKQQHQQKLLLKTVNRNNLKTVNRNNLKTVNRNNLKTVNNRTRKH
jgi:hypothetical protein